MHFKKRLKDLFDQVRNYPSHISPPTICCTVILILLTSLNRVKVPSQYFFDPTQLNNTATTQHNNNPGSVILSDCSSHQTTNLSNACGYTYKSLLPLVPPAALNQWKLVTWYIFVPSFATWVLPWLASATTLPYVTQSISSRYLTFCLTLGSPALAGYSLAVTVLTTRWIKENFKLGRGQQKKAMEHVSWILSRTQQIACRLQQLTPSALTQIITDPVNIKSWAGLRGQLSTTNERSAILALPVIMSILSIIQVWLSGADNNIILVGLALNSLWCWLLPLSWGWASMGVQLHPTSLPGVFDQFSVKYEGKDGTLRELSFRQLLLGDSEELGYSRDGFFDSFSYPRLAQEPDPCYNFVRFYNRLHVAKQFHSVLTLPSSNNSRGSDIGQLEKAAEVQFIERELDAEEEKFLDNVNELYGIEASLGERATNWGALFVGLLLQWGTTGPAILIAYITPVRGLGCSSGPYLTYGSAATIVCLLYVLAGHLSQGKIHPEGEKQPIRFRLATALVMIANFIAICNTTWLLTFSTLQFTNAYNNFWCACVAFGNLGRIEQNAYVALLITPKQIYETCQTAWIAGTCLVALVTAGCGCFFVWAASEDNIDANEDNDTCDDNDTREDSDTSDDSDTSEDNLNASEANLHAGEDNFGTSGESFNTSEDSLDTNIGKD